MDKVNLHRSWIRGSSIGKGSFGTVNLAVDNTNGDVFAVKSVNQTSCLPSQLHSLNNEIRFLRSLSSPYLINYLGDDTTYEDSPTTSYRNLHLEYMPAGTVADLAKNSGADVDERILRAHTWCIVSALEYVHSKGIVHCDVKGKNILLGPTNNTVKLADFGSAIEFSDSNNNSTRGSPLWMAPEVVRREYQGPESDVWSLGCTVIEMVTGMPAWEDHGADTLVRIGYSNEIPEFPTGFSELGRDFLEKCLRREVKKRWSCDQLLQHPFISMCSQPSKSFVTYSSPRCVLDWFSSDESEPVDEEEVYDAVKVRGRIGKLASERGAHWESDGWMVVRCSESSSDVCCSRGEGEGTTLAYFDLVRVEEENLGANLEYSDSIGNSEENGRANMEYFYSTNNSITLSIIIEGVEYSSYYDVVTECDEANSSCQYGCVQSDGAVGNREKGCYCCICNITVILSYFFIELYAKNLCPVCQFLFNWYNKFYICFVNVHVCKILEPFAILSFLKKL